MCRLNRVDTANKKAWTALQDCGTVDYPWHRLATRHCLETPAQRERTKYIDICEDDDALLVLRLEIRGSGSSFVTVCHPSPSIKPMRITRVEAQR